MQPGSRLDHYQILSAIDKGGMGPKSGHAINIPIPQPGTGATV